MSSRMLKKSANLSFPFGLSGLSRVFGFTGSRNKTNQMDQIDQIDQTNQTDQITRQTGLSQTCEVLDSRRGNIVLPQPAPLRVVHV